jgi:hypothetical protein
VCVYVCVCVCVYVCMCVCVCVCVCVGINGSSTGSHLLRLGVQGARTRAALA